MSSQDVITNWEWQKNAGKEMVELMQQMDAAYRRHNSFLEMLASNAKGDAVKALIESTQRDLPLLRQRIGQLGEAGETMQNSTIEQFEEQWRHAQIIKGIENQ